MITAVDTNVLLDVFLQDEQHGAGSAQGLRSAYDRGAIIVCDLVYAELVPAFKERADLDNVLREIGATPSPIDTAIAHEAGTRWRRYRAAGGQRKRIIADFVIGAHALAAAETFLTRDRGFYATYYPELRVAAGNE